MVTYLFDSNVIIDYARGYTPTVELLHARIKPEDAVLISAISETELFAGKSFEKLDEFLENEFPAKSVPVDSPIARKAGEIKRGNPSVQIIDALIAATALVHRCTLVTRNAKHFNEISGLSILNPS